MIINGIADSGKASIRMNGLKTLMLAGNAYIGSGNAMMGESLAVKSSQTAYLAPADCFLIKATNPTTVAEDFMAKSDFAATPEKYINYEVLKNYHAFDITPLVEKGIEVHVVGDCHEKAADINRAIEEGYLAANAI